MFYSFETTFTLICVLLALIDLYFACKAYQQADEIGNYLCLSAIMAGTVTTAYLFSVMTENYRQMSVASSIYFISIDWMLVLVLHFVCLFTGFYLKRSTGALRLIINICAAVDSLVLAANVFAENAVHYVRRTDGIVRYMYEMRAPYIVHLCFTYFLVLLILIILCIKVSGTPRQYRNQYILIMAAIMIVVVFNAAFLFLDDSYPFTQLDCSILVYSIGLYIMYWASFDYRRNYMPKTLSMTIFQNIGQGIVLFDHMEELILYNEKAAGLLPDADFRDRMEQQDFEEYCMLPPEVKKKDVFSLQIDRKGNQGQPLRCDFRRLRDNRGRVTGNLFVFTDAANDTDILTGFQHWENFRRFAVENPNNFDHPTSAVVFDIVGLSEINRTFGREVGNQRIRNLAKVIRTNMPRDAFFVRGYEAHLLAICSHCTEDELAGCVHQVIEACNGTVMYGMSATLDPVRISPDGYPRSGLKLTEGEESRNIIKAIATASRTLQVKKLLSSSSAHSQTITSLVRALQESDSDTEAHVQRTQKMGALLGKRIGLNDAQLADLNLLCLLHDIGKIGIPLEILNKPDRLSDREWVVMKTHSEKGYQIAMSSEELKPIARMILYHHERWDGKGYPERLAGSNIPILSRIISVVDSYDAMVNDRAYRKGFPPAVAQEELSRCAGTQFDPYLVEEFLKLLADHPDIAAGERTDAPEIRVFRRAELEEAETGSTLPVSHSRYFLDLEDTIIEVDDGFQEITGYSGAEAVGIMNQIELIPQEDRTDYMIQVNNQFAMGSDSAFLEHNIERRDGTVVRVLCHGKRYYDSASRSYRSEILITQI